MTRDHPTEPPADEPSPAPAPASTPPSTAPTPTDPPPEDPILITTTDRRADVPVLIYALSLRGINAHARHAPGQSDPWQIVAPTPAEARRARPALGLIWDTVLDATHAITPENTCIFCDYDLSGTPRPKGQPCVCPECGTDLASVEARRAARGFTRKAARRAFRRAGGNHP